jgi:hypothetical protein
MGQRWLKGDTQTITIWDATYEPQELKSQWVTNKRAAIMSPNIASTEGDVQEFTKEEAI